MANCRKCGKDKGKNVGPLCDACIEEGDIKRARFRQANSKSDMDNIALSVDAGFTNIILQIVGVIYLIASVFVSHQLGDIGYGDPLYSILTPIRFGILFQGILVWVILKAIANIHDAVIATRNNTRDTVIAIRKQGITK